MLSYMAQDYKEAVLNALLESEKPMMLRDLAAVLGLPEQWTVSSVIRRLRQDGRNIITVPCRGYWLAEKGPPPKREPKAPYGEFKKLYKGRGWVSGIEKLVYPADWVLIRNLIEERGVSANTLFNVAEEFVGGGINKSFIYNALYGRGKTRPSKGMTWRKFWGLAQALEVPPEMLIDENFFLYRGKPSVVPGRFAGYKLLFGALKAGLHPLDLVPPMWTIYDKIEDLKANPQNYPHALAFFRKVYRGEYAVFKQPDTVLYICARLGVSPAELFIGYKSVTATPLQTVHSELSELKQWDALFLAATAKLLCKVQDVDDATLLSELALLIRERGEWRRKLIRNEKKARKPASDGAAEAATCGQGNNGGNVGTGG